VEQSFYRNKVLLDISAEYGREVKDLFSLLGGGGRRKMRRTERERDKVIVGRGGACERQTKGRKPKDGSDRLGDDGRGGIGI